LKGLPTVPRPPAATRQRTRSARSRRASTDALFKALADPTRRDILALLRTRQRSVGEIAGNFRISRPAISKHLGLLRNAGLVVDRPMGTTTMCRLDAAPLRDIDAWLRDYETFWATSLTRLKAHLEDDE
jgi:DNA-binding transcriptional ArsR family regulator